VDAGDPSGKYNSGFKYLTGEMKTLDDPFFFTRGQDLVVLGCLSSLPSVVCLRSIQRLSSRLNDH
jgi:hypothetical protein